VPHPNELRWNRRPGHYEVYYLTLTDPATGIGAWVRYTLEAPLHGEPSCALWFATMDPDTGVVARKATRPITELSAAGDPFSLRIGEAELTDATASGAFEDVAWELRWQPGRTYEPVPGRLQRFASTVLVLPHGDVGIDGTLKIGERSIELSGARGGQTHLWGTKHAATWAWARCSDFRTEDGEPVPDTFVDGVSARVRRFGRDLGPSTLLVGRVGGEDLRSTALLSRRTTFGPTDWRFEASAGPRTLVGEVAADPRLQAGVTYHDPDGEPAYCYNSEAASMRLEVRERGKPPITLVGDGRAHFEHGLREPLPDAELHLR
jgi:hypothetical protein